MKSLKIVSSSFLILLLMFSCSIQKRVHRSGYNIEWRKKLSNKNETTFSNRKEEKSIAKQSENDKFQENVTPSIKFTDDLLTSTSKKPIVNSNKKTKSEIVTLPKSKKANFKSEFKKGVQIFSLTANEQKNHGLAIASMVLGILSLITYYGAILFAILAIIFAVIALKKIKANPDMFKGKGMAKTGLILGIIAIVIWTILIAVLVASV